MVGVFLFLLSWAFPWEVLLCVSSPLVVFLFSGVVLSVCSLFPITLVFGVWFFPLVFPSPPCSPVLLFSCSPVSFLSSLFPSLLRLGVPLFLFSLPSLPIILVWVGFAFLTPSSFVGSLLRGRVLLSWCGEGVNGEASPCWSGGVGGEGCFFLLGWRGDVCVVCICG